MYIVCTVHVRIGSDDMYIRIGSDDSAKTLFFHMLHEIAAYTVQYSVMIAPD